MLLVLSVLLVLLSGCGSHAGQADLRMANADVGAPAFDDGLVEKLAAKWSARDASYQPRTHHLHTDGSPKYTNRLFLESSPYLLQHAHNPVNWFPWGNEAFALAKELNRPVLLSVGYSTCHWCHVMEEESFEDEEIARYLNESYVAVKVDREERPDVDAIYMAAVQAFSGRGGWPMTVWLTPDRKPFYAATYIPARDGDRGVRTGFLRLLGVMKKAFDDRPDDVARNAQTFTDEITRMLTPQPGTGLPDKGVLDTAAQFYIRNFDSEEGGMQGAPKFPSSMPVRFLLREHRRTADKKLLDMASLTLDKMARGGIYDQVGGGFHRYSTDANWLVPHFEKMLYDNALLVVAYLEGYQATGREEFATTAREILRYVDRDMTSPDGAFYSATDADSANPEGEREEGWFFTWTPAELREVLGEEQARIVESYYAVTEQGNFEGRNILSRPKPRKEPESIAQAREKLYQARQQRPPPLRDEKILTAWNGLMISAHAVATLTLGEPDYAERGARAADFILRNLSSNGRLLRSYKDGAARHNAYLEDYAFLTAALIDLYEATGTLRWLEEAIRIEQVLAEQYEDREQGGFFLTSNDHETLLAREKPAYDGAEPSGNSVAVLNLLRLYEFTAEERYRQRAERALTAFEPILKKRPAALSELLPALDFYLDTPKEIVIVTRDGRDQAEPLLARLRQTFVPNRILTVVRQGDELEAHSKTVPLVARKVARKGQATAYVCERRVCELPTTDPDVFATQLTRSPGRSQ